MNKKGFTLVELLAVIAILGVIMLLVLPNVLNTFTKGKVKAFQTQLESISKAASDQYGNDLASGEFSIGETAIYCDGIGYSCPKLSLRKRVSKYSVGVGSDGLVYSVGLQDDNYCYFKMDLSNPIDSFDESDFVENGTLSCTTTSCTCSN